MPSWLAHFSETNLKTVETVCRTNFLTNVLRNNIFQFRDGRSLVNECRLIFLPQDEVSTVRNDGEHFQCVFCSPRTTMKGNNTKVPVPCLWTFLCFSINFCWLLLWKWKIWVTLDDFGFSFFISSSAPRTLIPWVLPNVSSSSDRELFFFFFLKTGRHRIIEDFLLRVRWWVLLVCWI